MAVPTRTEVDVAVIGAGVVGLATAAALARAGREVVVLERNEDIAREASSRNSEVIHAGLYYPEGSAKARTCLRGRELLYERCQARGIPHRRMGKLVVAQDEAECEVLARLVTRGRANGARGLELLEGAEVAALEPQVHARQGLLSPETGIVDAMAYARSFQAEAETLGAGFAFTTELVGVELERGGYRLSVESAGSREEVRAASVVNAAGVAADRVLHMVGLDPDLLGCKLHPCKGDYFSLAPGAPIRLERLVYPVPAGPGLGIHATLDLSGRLRFGPDAEFVGAPGYAVDPAGYAVDPAKAEVFAAAAARYLPGMQASWLTPDFAGVRARLAGPGEAFRDFVIAERSEHGRPGWVDLVGIESPGLTAAAALGEEVAELLAGL